MNSHISTRTTKLQYLQSNVSNPTFFLQFKHFLDISNFINFYKIIILLKLNFYLVLIKIYSNFILKILLFYILLNK